MQSGPPERYVRRRLRLFLRQQEYLQKCRLVRATPERPVQTLSCGACVVKR